MRKFFRIIPGFLIFIALSTLSIVYAQDPAGSPTPPDETIKIYTEEIKLNIIARSIFNGKPVPNLKADDLLVVESGDPQTITSLKRFPASVLILMDTGSNVNFGKRTELTRLLAKVIVRGLSEADSMAAIQYYDRIETISDWTRDKNSIYENLDNKMFTGKRSRFTDALNVAVESFRERPLENRNLVLISDGLETVRKEAEVQRAIRRALEANISIHIISYTALQRQNSAGKTKKFKINKEKTPPRVPDYIFETILDGITVTPKERAYLKAMTNESQRIGIINLDREMIKFIENKRLAWEAGEARLKNLADQTGGEFHAPESPEYMLEFAAEIARTIGSQYVLTYTPTRPFADTGDSREDRKIRVSTHRGDVRIRSRQNIFVTNDPEKKN